MAKSLSKVFLNTLEKDHDELIIKLKENGYIFPELPENLNAIQNTGEAYSLAYPIQGILKYHGFYNKDEKISYFPSISFNNTGARTVSFLRFDDSYQKDKVVLNGTPVKGDKASRVEFALNKIRSLTNIDTKALLISRNILNTEKSGEMGKGVGTSAAGSAALGYAAASILYKKKEEYINNSRLISILSRYLSASGCRSAVGGFGLWLSHPLISYLDSYALRLDRKSHDGFVDNISTITIPVSSQLKTNQAHELAPSSPFFITWLKYRKKLILDFLDALEQHNLERIGELAEHDTMCLHSVTMTAPHKENIIAWEPETIRIMHRVRKLRKGGYQVYFSVDTGPTTVLLCRKKDTEQVIKSIQKVVPNQLVIKGKIGRAPKLLNSNSKEIEPIEKDINQFV